MGGQMFTEDAIKAIGEGLLARTLPAAQWTHAAHCLAGLYLLTRRSEIDLDLQLPGIIWRYNEAVGTANSDTDGYHETITRFYLMALRSFLSRLPRQTPLVTLAEVFMTSQFGASDFILDYYSKDCVQSLQARRVWIEPDLRPLDFTLVPLVVR
jgi:hypothetical protein